MSFPFIKRALILTGRQNIQHNEDMKNISYLKDLLFQNPRERPAECGINGLQNHFDYLLILSDK